MMKMLGGIVLSALLALSSAALAQVQIITPVTCVSGCAAPVTPSLSSNTPAPLVVTSSTGNVAFADSTSTYPAAMLLNDGANELYFALGNSGVTAAATNQPLPAGRSICVAITVGVTNVAAISPSGSTLKVTQATGCPPASGGGGGSGGGGSNAAAGTTGSAVPGSADYQGVNIGGNNVGQTGRAVGSAKAADVALNDASGNQIGTATNPVRTDPTGTTKQSATVADGDDIALGAKADTVCGSSTGTCSLEALIKYLNTQAALIVANTGAALPGELAPTHVGDVAIIPSASSTLGIIPGISASSAASSVVLKSSAGNLYDVYARSGTAGWLMIFNATSAPSDGSTTAGIASGNLQDCIPAVQVQTGEYLASINYAPGPMEVFANGITAVYSSTSCGTKTASATAFIHGRAQ